MAYSEQLAERIRKAISGCSNFAEKRMFGGLCFTLNGHMCCGIVGDTLMLRLGSERAVKALTQPHVREMDFTGRPLKGMIYVDPSGITLDADFESWIRKARDFAGSLPPKEAKPKTKRKPGSPLNV